MSSRCLYQISQGRENVFGKQVWQLFLSTGWENTSVMLGWYLVYYLFICLFFAYCSDLSFSEWILKKKTHKSELIDANIFHLSFVLSLSLSSLLSPTVSSCWRLGGMMRSQAGGGVTGQESSSRVSSLASSFHCYPSSTWSLQRVAMAYSSVGLSLSSSVTLLPTWPSSSCSSWPHSI